MPRKPQKKETETQPDSRLKSENRGLRHELEYLTNKSIHLENQNAEFLRVIKFYEAQFEHARHVLAMVPIPVSYGVVMPKEEPNFSKSGLNVSIPVKP